MENLTKPSTKSLKIKTVNAWSFSRLSNFERCPYCVFLSSVQKEQGPKRDNTHPAERGVKIHGEAEDYAQEIIAELPHSLRKLEPEFKMLRELHTEGKLEIEQDWGFDINWDTCDYFGKNIWLRVKCDVVIHHDKTQATIIDHKTGKSFGNEVKHISQGQLYAVAAFMKYPELERIDVEFWYIDEGKTKKKSYDRKKIIRPLETFTQRGLAVTTCINFQAKPNVHNCMWCDFGPNKGTGVCTYGVEP